MHTPLFWGSEKTDTRGQIIENFLLSNNNICLLNTGKATYCSPSSRKMSCIDLSFCSSSVFMDFKWDVLNDPYGSDHLPILISQTTTPQVIQQKPQRWKLHLADSALFQEKACLEKLETGLNIDEQNECITNCIVTAARLSIPQTSGLAKENRKTWYTCE